MNREYLDIMEIDLWQSKEAAPLAAASTDEASLPTDTQSIWETLATEVKNCTLCPLHKSRTQTVFGVGNQHADILFIGEAPGAQEDAQGEPFVGRAGQLLNSMLKAIGLSREEIYIANILKCRPPNNRDPLPEEEECCTPYLKRQIALIKPKLIVAVGRIAAQFLLNTNTTIGKLRNQVHHYSDDRVPLIVIYHPAYLLRSPGEKSKAYKDMLMIKQAASQ